MSEIEKEAWRLYLAYGTDRAFFLTQIFANQTTGNRAYWRRVGECIATEIREMRGSVNPSLLPKNVTDKRAKKQDVTKNVSLN